MKRNANGHLWRRLDTVRHGGKLKLNRHFIRSRVQSCVSRVSNLHTRPQWYRDCWMEIVHSRDSKSKVSAGDLHLRLPYTWGRALVIWHWGVTDPQLLLFSVHQNATCVRDCFFPGSADTIPQGDEPFSQQPEEGQNSRLLDSFQFNWPPGWPRQHLVKFQASRIPWFICDNIHKYRANEAVGTRFEWVFAANETWIVTSAGEVQPELCTHQIWDLHLEVC